MPEVSNYASKRGSGVSIVVEWENVLLAGSKRAKAMLQSLIRQSNENSNILEIIISSNYPCEDLNIRPSSLNPQIKWRLENFEGRHYYELKNLGADLAIGEIIVFIDSDVIPAEDWLSQLLETFKVKSSKVLTMYISLGI